MKKIELNQISRPTLIVDIDKVKLNIQRIKEKISKLNIEFRPHFKTHQSKFIGNVFKEFGIKKITVSSLSMAHYFLQSNWNDILIAFPLNLREMDEILKLSGLINLSVTVSDLYTLEYLNRILTTKMNVYLEFDIDYYRSGFDYKDNFTIQKVIKLLTNSKNLSFKGIIAHNGLTYSATTKEEVVKLNKTFVEKIFHLKSYFIEKGFSIIASIGDTPSVSICDDFQGIDELRPGNFVFYDVMQLNIGSCTLSDIAVCAILPIVSINYKANQIICYGGATSLSKDFIEMDGIRIYGLVAPITENGWLEPFEDTYVSKLTQEHCVISSREEIVRQYKPGDLIGILPIHSCLTADAMKSYFVPGFGYVDHL
ncbi:MAG: alanine racemase [Candidatus Kapaibacteriales bacterium]